jgi:hypothetical protein
MKKIEYLTKRELIALVTELKPKAEAYDRACEEMGIKKNLLTALKKLKNKRLIDAMEEALLNGKVEVIRDGWEDTDYSKEPAVDDHCEWLDIKVYNREGDCYTVHFYFTENSTLLEHIEIFFEKKIVTFDDMKKLAGKHTVQSEEKEKLALQLKEKRKQKSVAGTNSFIAC